VLDRIRALGTNVVVVSAAPAQRLAGRRRQGETMGGLLPRDVASILDGAPSAARAAGAIEKSLVVRFEGANTTTRVQGLAPDGLGVRNITIAAGRAHDDEDERTRRRVAILGPTVVQNLFGAGAGSSPVGLGIRIGAVPFEVIGVAARRGLDPAGVDQDDIVLIPLETALRRVLNAVYLHTIYVEARSPAAIDPAAREVAAVLAARAGAGSGPERFRVATQTELVATHRRAAEALTLLVGSVAGIALLVGGIGILAVMIISVRERTPEVGLRRALGARRRDIVLQFLLEATLLAGAGGLLGALLGVLGAHAAAALAGWEAVVSWPSVALALAVAVALGLLFGIYPARRAARLEPIAALRVSA
jgi:putative ABC transport system permease protein